MKLAYKGFDNNLQCRGYQFEIGKEFKHEGKVKACESGFHSCEYPLDVFSYYPPAGNRFALVEVDGDISSDTNDSKIASSNLTIKAELTLAGMINAAIEYTFKGAKKVKGSTTKADGKAASATGGRGAASATGGRGAASATGGRGAASATGYQGAASATGDYGAASATGDYGAASATGDYGAASATGDYGAASATGYQGAASATGKDSAAMASGYEGRAKAAEGCAVFLVYRDTDYKIIHAKGAIAGKDIKADTWYMLNASGEFVEAA
jgi:hypothetical protein